MSGWGLKFFDYDNDGNLDLFLANGHPDDMIEEHSTKVKYREPMLLFRNNGRRFEEFLLPVVRSSPSPMPRAAWQWVTSITMAPWTSLSRQQWRPLAGEEQCRATNHWLGLKLVAKQANPDAIGAVITCQAGDLKRSMFKTGGGSYLASHDPRLVLGIGTRPKIDWVEIKWPMPSGGSNDSPISPSTNTSPYRKAAAQKSNRKTTPSSGRVTPFSAFFTLPTESLCTIGPALQSGFGRWRLKVCRSLRFYSLRRIETVDRFQIVSCQDLRSRNAGLRRVFPDHLDLPSFRQVTIQDEQGVLPSSGFIVAAASM